jgi:hypothetical protein
MEEETLIRAVFATLFITLIAHFSIIFWELWKVQKNQKKIMDHLGIDKEEKKE